MQTNVNIIIIIIININMQKNKKKVSSFFWISQNVVVQRGRLSSFFI